MGVLLTTEPHRIVDRVRLRQGVITLEAFE